MVTEFMDGGDLSGLIFARVPITEGAVAFVMQKMCEALGWMHHVHRIHRDVKSDNILVSLREIFSLQTFTCPLIVGIRWEREIRGFWISCQSFSRGIYANNDGWNTFLDGARSRSRNSVWF